MPFKDKSKRRQWDLDRYHRKRREAIEILGGKCTKCGSDAKLEVDHIDPMTKVSSAFWCWSIARRDKELAKCQVLCSGCHLAKTRAYAKTDPRIKTTPSHKPGCQCAAHRRARSLEMSVVLEKRRAS